MMIEVNIIEIVTLSLVCTIFGMVLIMALDAIRK